MSLSYRALALLLRYPTDETRAALDEAVAVLQKDAARVSSVG